MILLSLKKFVSKVCLFIDNSCHKCNATASNTSKNIENALSAPVRKCHGSSKNRKHLPEFLALGWQNLAHTQAAKASPPTMILYCSEVPSSNFLKGNLQNNFIRTVFFIRTIKWSANFKFPFSSEKVKITFSNVILCWIIIGNTDGKQAVSRYWFRR